MGLAGLMKQTGFLTGSALMGALMSVGAIQGVCDPTNTHNVWIANFLGVDVVAVTRKLLPYIWVLAFLGLLVGAVKLF